MAGSMSSIAIHGHSCWPFSEFGAQPELVERHQWSEHPAFATDHVTEPHVDHPDAGISRRARFPLPTARPARRGTLCRADSIRPLPRHCARNSPWRRRRRMRAACVSIRPACVPGGPCHAVGFPGCVAFFASVQTPAMLSPARWITTSWPSRPSLSITLSFGFQTTARSPCGRSAYEWMTRVTSSPCARSWRVSSEPMSPVEPVMAKAHPCLPSPVMTRVTHALDHEPGATLRCALRPRQVAAPTVEPPVSGGGYQ